MLARRQSLEAAFMAAAAQGLTQHLLAVIGDAPGIIAGYCPVRGEIDCIPALAALSEKGREVCLPVVHGGMLVFRAWRPGELLVKGAYGIDVPPDDAVVLIPNIVIVPLLAFDGKGHRLGYGAGYYDRTIAALRAQGKKPLLIGVAYAMQQVETVFAQAHDAQLDAVATQKGVIRFT